ncbi:MAG: protease modulator HflC [Fibrobacteria bacterium]|nr:protease modulator HflC [Fibrobacteria bacterium]
MKRFIFVLIFLLLGLFLSTSMFQLDETQLCVVTQFGNPVKHNGKPGLHYKLPSPFQKVIRFDKRVQIFNPKPMEFLTADKQNIIADGFICWKIDETTPLTFLKSLGNTNKAELFLTDIFVSELGAALGTYNMENLVSTEEEKVKTASIMQEVTRQCAAVSHSNGIKVLTVRIKKLYLPEQNKPSVFARMSEERNRIAKKYRAEGQEKSMEITSQANKEKSEIISKSKKQAEIILGQGEAAATRIYAEAYRTNPDFFNFLRTLEAYEKFLNTKTTIVLSPKSDLLKLLTEGK